MTSWASTSPTEGPGDRWADIVTSGGGQGDREALHAPQEAVSDVLDGADLLDGAGGVEQLLEHHLDLEAGDGRTHAHMGPGPEGEMRVGVALEVEALGIGEDRLVEVGR